VQVRSRKTIDVISSHIETVRATIKAVAPERATISADDAHIEPPGSSSLACHPKMAAIRPARERRNTALNLAFLRTDRAQFQPEGWRHTLHRGETVYPT
jgi:hypothetical protein